MADIPDASLNEIVYDKNHVERRPWRICNTTLSRSFAVFAVQVFIAFMIIIISCLKLFLSNSCEENQIFVGALTLALGFLFPNPKL